MNVKELRRLYASGTRNFSNIDLNEANLRNINLSGADLRGAKLNVVNLSGANLSGANLSGAKLNVARLSGANLSKAILNHTHFNVANLIRADLREAEFIEALIIRAELIRADLSGANLSGSNLEGTDLREANLREATLSYCNLSEANLRGAFLTESVLEQATLSGADLRRADLQRANIREADLSQSTLTRAILSGADLRGANLRWTDLSGADLRWADLSDAKLSGANLTGADLSHANLVNASLVHSDLSRARLIQAEWTGADLTGATLTGSKIYNVSHFGLKTEGISCDWVDLSPEGDESQVYRLDTDKTQKFFNKTPPTVQVTIDSPFNLYANLALATIYHQISLANPKLEKPPSIKVSSRRTYLTFKTDNNEDLFLTAYYATLPFRDCKAVERNLRILLQTVQMQKNGVFKTTQHKHLRELGMELSEAIAALEAIEKDKMNLLPDEAREFLNASTYTVISNSRNKQVDVYHNPEFGQHFSANPTLLESTIRKNALGKELVLPPTNILVQFIQDFFYDFDILGRSHERINNRQWATKKL
ncbi:MULTISPECIES: pentapeptide repeat-containing protein [Spirulina sp. CCY15215]|uniref:pentapeptide repeat-containing protein n=1 Tax=Spirulina sp. CCY15215 TaxID=2767591 RepID=UPI00194F883E|nr:pentapeptide repeat-containing protein [Spirulina major]